MVQISNSVLLNWLTAANTSNWTEVSLPCAYTTEYRKYSSITAKSSTTTGSTIPCTLRENNSLTKLYYATYGASTNFTIEFFTIGY